MRGAELSHIIKRTKHRLLKEGIITENQLTEVNGIIDAYLNQLKKRVLKGDEIRMTTSDDALILGHIRIKRFGILDVPLHKLKYFHVSTKKAGYAYNIVFENSSAEKKLGYYFQVTPELFDQMCDTLQRTDLVYSIN